ncbi:MAG: prepilin-type N-terminal cleavage/methylation domain-containing protein [Gemmatimonadales bacterium]|jgi:prepilin-type N-terminal cleavage/methylation domain-containing protein
MTRLKGNRGFTLVEILTVLLLIAVLVTIAWSRYQRSFEKALVATMVSDLRNSTTAQELYHRLHLTYAPSIDLLNIDPSPTSRITVTEATARGWAGWTEIERVTDRCEIYVGDAASPLGIASASEQVSCARP